MERITIMDKSFEDFIPKYYKIKNTLIQDIKKGEYLVNSKLPPITELMKTYSISTTTARRVVHELVKEGFVYTVPSKGCFVSVPSTKRNQDLISTSKRVVFIIPDYITNNFFAYLINGILKVVQSKGYKLDICNSHATYSNETRLLSQYLEERVAGLIFFPVYYDKNYKHLFELRKRGTQIVLISRHIKNYNLDYIGCANIKSVKKAVKYLIKRGHKRIVFLGGSFSKNTSSIIDRLEGYKQALKEKKIKVDPDLILIKDNEEDYMTTEISVKNLIKKLLSKGKKFDAIFSINDETAISAYNLLKEKGIKIPQDVSLIGFDDIRLSRYFEVPLTTIKVDLQNLGETAAKLLFKRIERNLSGKAENTDTLEKILLNTKFIIRDSVKKRN